MAGNRPVAHLAAPRNWINDPNGFIWFDGQYHLYSQHFPYAPLWGRMHWTHATSKDLTVWEHHDIVLFPSKSYDSDGCFSGSAIVKDGQLLFFYTGVDYVEADPENINKVLHDTYVACQVRIASPDGFTFDNLAGKQQVIPPIKNQALGSRYHTRDPKVWEYNGMLYMILGSKVQEPGKETTTPKVLIFRSKDSYEWEFLNELASYGTLGYMWECPDLFCVDGQWMLTMSPMGMLDIPHVHANQAIIAKVGFDNDTGEIDWDGKTYQFVDFGLDYYAGQSTLDKDGRRIHVGWLRMTEALPRCDFMGVYCFPRLVEMKDGIIYTPVHPDICAHFTDACTEQTLDRSKAFKISATLSEGQQIKVGQYTVTAKAGSIVADRTGMVEEPKMQLISATPALDEALEVEVYVDHCVVEVYVNGGRYAIAHIVNPEALAGELSIPEGASIAQFA